MRTSSPDKTEPQFSITSLDLAAYFIACGFDLVGYHRLPDGRLVFHFPERVKDEVSGYFAGENVPAIKYWDALKRLKAVIHSG